jgi:hypothetical protein
MSGLPVPSPPVFTAGTPPVPATFTGWITDTLGFCTAGIVFRAQQQVTQSFSANTQTVVTFDTVLEDPYSGWNAASHEWLAPATGWYEVTSTLVINSLNATLTNTIFLSGVTQYAFSAIAESSSYPGGACASAYVPLVIGQDFVQVRLFATAAGSTDVSSAGFYSSLEISFVTT